MFRNRYQLGRDQVKRCNEENRKKALIKEIQSHREPVYFEEWQTLPRPRVTDGGTPSLPNSTAQGEQGK